MRSDHGLIRLTDAHNQGPTMTESCAQATTDMDTPQTTSIEQCAQSMTNAGDPQLMSHG